MGTQRERKGKNLDSGGVGRIITWEKMMGLIQKIPPCSQITTGCKEVFGQEEERKKKRDPHSKWGRRNPPEG